MSSDFISTDIDKIIKILKKVKKISLNDLAKESEISASLLEKWLPILEDEGLIDISYHLTRVYITWLGEEDIKTTRRDEGVEFPVDLPTDISEGYPIKEEEPEDSSFRKLPASAKGKSKEELEFEFDRVSKETEIEIPKEIIEKKITTPAEALQKVEPDLIIPKEVENVSIKQKSKTKGIEVKPLKFDIQEQRKTKLDARAKKIKDYMEDINRARDELEKLKTEKRKLFLEVYEPIEKKFSVEVDAISEKIAEKEQRILELQQKVLLLPGVIEEVDRQQLRLREIEEEARKTFDDASIAINESLTDLSELETLAGEQIKTAREHINLGATQAQEMNSLLEKIGSLEFEVREKINEARVRLEEEQKKINLLETSLHKLEGVKEKTSEKVNEVVNSVETQKRRIQDLHSELNKLGDIQKWVSKHKEEYGILIDEFGEQLKENELEYNKLREAIETDFVRRYIEDLSGISKGYEFELDKAKEAEKNIDEKIDSAKKRISELLSKSREIVDAFEGTEKDAPLDLNVKVVTDKERQLLQKVQNKEEERKKILQTLEDLSSDVSVETPKSKKEKPKKAPKILSYQEFLSQKRSEGLSMKQISRAWKKYKKEHKI